MVLRSVALTGFPPWIHRAHLHALEITLPFAVPVSTAYAIGLSDPLIHWASALFLWLRLAHAVGIVSGIARFPLRPILLTLGWLILLIFAAQIVLQKEWRKLQSALPLAMPGLNTLEST